jgi:hypothetical protein
MRFVSLVVLCGILGYGGAQAAAAFRVDSVTVDSVWNADTTDQYGIPWVQRDVKLSFKPISAGTDSITCVVDMSFDSGKTWCYNREIFDRSDTIGATRAAPNVKRSIIIYYTRGDTTNVVFRVTARSDTVTLNGLRMTSPFNGWSEIDSTYRYFQNAHDLALLMDGYDIAYMESGVVDGYSISLTKPDSLNLHQYVMDAGTEARASSTYNAQRPTSNTDSLAYPDSVAVAKKVLNGITAFAHFRHFFLSFSFSGYTVQDSAVSHANALFEYYRQKIER